MGRGVNIIGYDPIWKEFAQARFQDRHFQRIKAAGFQHVRVNLHAFAHMDASNTIEDSWLRTLDWVVEQSLGNGLTVILDEHDFGSMGKDAAAGTPKLLAFWGQVAARYRDSPDSVVFEILNEPNESVTPELWNEILADALAIIRESNPSRNIIIGPAYWNNIHYLEQLNLPEADRQVIATVHYYIPMEFTHQGAPWNKETTHLRGITWGSESDRQLLTDDFAGVQQWSEKMRRPILLGEFGAYDKGDIDSRVAYTSAVAREAEKHGWAWSYWQFDSDFVAYDIAKDDWNEPILRALVP